MLYTILKHVNCRFQQCDLFSEMFKFRDLRGILQILRNLLWPVIFSESPDHVL